MRDDYDVGGDDEEEEDLVEVVVRCGMSCHVVLTLLVLARSRVHTVEAGEGGPCLRVARQAAKLAPALGRRTARPMRPLRRSLTHRHRRLRPL